MANPYYTASPMVNFNYESKPSEAQGVLDTMKKIKKEGIEDETRQMKMLEAQQAYEMGNLKMQGAQMEMDKVKRREQIEQQSSQIYNAQLASGVPRSQAMKAVTDYRQANLDWSERQEDLEEMKKSSLEALKFADRVPPEALADAAAQFSISFGVEVTPEQFQQMSKNRQPVTTKDGRIYEWDNAQGDYTEKTPTALAKRLDEDRKLEQQTEQNKLDMERKRIAISGGNLSLQQQEFADRREQNRIQNDLKTRETESKIAYKNAQAESVKTKVADLPPDQKRVAKFEERNLNTILNKIDSLKVASATGKVDFIDAILAERGLNVGTLNAMTPQDRKAKINDLIEEYKSALDVASADMEERGIPGSADIAKIARQKAGLKVDAPVNPTANPAGVASGTKTLDLGSKYGLALQNAKKRQSAGGK